MTDTRSGRRRVLSWALWDWGSAAFNAVVTTFVFSTYLSSQLFVDPAIVEAAAGNDQDPALSAALASGAATVATALAIAGAVIALIAPVIGQRSDGSGRRKLWLGVHTAVVVLAMVAMFWVKPDAHYLVLGATLLAVGNVFFEFATVNYNAMLTQVSTPKTVGRISGLGWGLGYVGGIVLLIALLLLFILDLGGPGSGLLGLPSGRDGGALDVRLAVLASALWFAVFAIPVFLAVPEPPRTAGRRRTRLIASYRALWGTVVGLKRERPQVLLFLVSSAIMRDGLAGVFTFGAIIAANVYGFSSTEVLYFAVAANLVAGIGTFTGGWLDDALGAKRVILASTVGLAGGGVALLVSPGSPAWFWVLGLFMCVFVGPMQSSSRTFLARITPAGREGEMFGLYATTGRAVSFITPGLFALFVSLAGSTKVGILAVTIVLLAGLALLLPVREPAPTAR